MRGLSADVPEVAERLRLATRDALVALVDAAIERRVDFMIVAGDLYDGDWRDYQTGVFFVRQMHRLAEHVIPVYLIYGNHDAASVITRALSLPDNVHVFSHDKAQTETIDDLQVALHGLSYAKREVTDNLVPHYPAPQDGYFNIGLLHTSLAGYAAHETYAPCALDELVAKGYDYWALGHVHEAQILNEHPHVVFSGNLQGRSIRETGPKSVFEVCVEDARVTRLTPIHCDVARWAHVAVDVGDADDLNDILRRMREALDTARSEYAESRLLAARLRLSGTTGLHARLVAAGDWLLAEARAAAAGLGMDDIYVEKVRVATAPIAGADTRRARQDAIGELQRLLDAAGHDPEVHALIEKDIQRLIQRLPAAIRAETDDALLRAALDGDTTQLVTGAGDYLIARLSGSNDDHTRP